MLHLIEKVVTHSIPDTSLTLPLEKRIKSRLHVTLDNGEEAGVFLERGETLQDGDVLRSEEGRLVEICAAKENVSCVKCDDALLLARACYHLGNRHVPLQIEAEQICYLHDHVLDDMLRGLGLVVQVLDAPFEPESGAYGNTNIHAHNH